MQKEIFEETAKEVARKNGAVLFESEYSSDGCPVNVLKEYFPDYDFKENFEYLIEIDGVLYTGDTLMEKYYQK